jgi:hypothetical protein
MGIFHQSTASDLQSTPVQSVFIAVSVALFVAVITTMFSIVHDVFPYLSEQHRACFRSWTRSFGGNINRPLRSAWDEHARRLPNSRKRILFAAFLVAAFLSVMAYPLWVALAPR